MNRVEVNQSETGNIMVNFHNISKRYFELLERCRPIAILSVIICMVTAAFGGNIDWTGGNTNWFETSNWNLGRLPSVALGDTARILNGGTARIEAAGAEASGVTLGVGWTGAGNLYIGSGATVNISTRIDVFAKANNTSKLTIAGGATTLGGEIWMYGVGAGIVEMTGGTVSMTGINASFIDADPGVNIFQQSGGVITMTGNRDIYLSKGIGQSSLELSGSGVITNADIIRLGYDANGCIGSLSVSDSASLWLTTLYAGGDDPGLNMATGIVTVAGGLLSATTEIAIGKYGWGECTISSGRVETAGFTVGDQSTAHGALSMSDGTLYASGNFLVASQGGYGDVQQSGGTIDVSNLFLTYGLASIKSSYTLSGGILRVRGAITAGGTAAGQTFDFTGGTFSAFLYDASMPALTNAGGILSPGLDVAGNCRINDSYIETSSSAGMSINIGGTTAATSFTNTAGHYDFIQVSGDVTLAGNLSISLIDVFEQTIQASDLFYIMTASTDIAGAFANVASGERIYADNGDSFAVHYGNNAATTGAGMNTKFITLSDFQFAAQGTLITIN